MDAIFFFKQKTAYEINACTLYVLAELFEYYGGVVSLLSSSLLTKYTGCPRRNVPDFGRVFLMLKYTDITQNNYVYIQS